jgi:hypothetical protein
VTKKEIDKLKDLVKNNDVAEEDVKRIQRLKYIFRDIRDLGCTFEKSHDTFDGVCIPIVYKGYRIAEYYECGEHVRQLIKPQPDELNPVLASLKALIEELLSLGYSFGESYDNLNIGSEMIPIMYKGEKWTELSCKTGILFGRSHKLYMPAEPREAIPPHRVELYGSNPRLICENMIGRMVYNLRIWELIDLLLTGIDTLSKIDEFRELETKFHKEHPEYIASLEDILRKRKQAEMKLEREYAGKWAYDDNSQALS